jgi:hypothetical protein
MIAILIALIGLLAAIACLDVGLNRAMRGK